MNENFQELKKVIEETVASPHSDFYRKKYKKAGFDVASAKKIEEIPFLTKEEMISVPIGKRTFVPSDSITYYSVSSGTTDSANPLIVPHSNYGLPSDSEMSRVYSKDLDVKKLLFLLPPSSPGLMRLIHPMKELGKIFIPGNVRNLELTAKVAGEIGIDAIFTTPTLLSFFTDYLKQANYDLQSIKLISLRGEFCSAQKFEYFKEVFSNAEIDIKYGGSEIGNIIGYRCEYLLDSPPNIYHISPDCMVETIDEEIIYSDLSTGKAFPLIRYRTKDVGKLIESGCPCGNNIILEMGGRMGHDMVKFHGVTLYTASIEESLVEAKEFMEPGRFRVHVREEREGDKIMPRLSIELGIRQDIEPDEFVKGVISESIAKRLYLSADKSLKDLIERGIFLPLDLTLKKDWPHDLKSRNIISHF